MVNKIQYLIGIIIYSLLLDLITVKSILQKNIPEISDNRPQKESCYG